MLTTGTKITEKRLSQVIKSIFYEGEGKKIS